MSEADQLREERDNIGALAARRLDEIDRLREALRGLYDGAVAKGPSSIPAFKKAREALGDTPDKCPICGLPTTAGPYQCMGHLGDTPR